jgi:hypothetical protein
MSWPSSLSVMILLVGTLRETTRRSAEKRFLLISRVLDESVGTKPPVWDGDTTVTLFVV